MRRGFSLLELSIVVAIMAVVSVMGLEGAASFLNRSAARATQEKLAALDAAMVQFFRAYGRIPCPSAYALGPTNTAYGAEDCTIAVLTGTTIGGGVMAGGIPFRALNLPIETSLDGYGNKLFYFATKNLTIAGSGAAASFGGSAGVSGIEIRTGLLQQPCSTTCQVLVAPSAVLASNFGASYAIISPGADKRGARNRFGVVQKNCAATAADNQKIDAQNCTGLSTPTVAIAPASIPLNVLYDSRFNAGNQEVNFFDDLVIWRTQGQL